MLAAVLVAFVLHAISATADPFRVHQKSGRVFVTQEVEEELYKLKINGWDYQRLATNQCIHYKPKFDSKTCGYNPWWGKGTLRVDDASAVQWVGFEMYPWDPTRTGYLTVYFTQDNTWKEVHRLGCIIPYESSPSTISAKKTDQVLIKCARKKSCHYDDRTLTIYVDGKPKCYNDKNTNCGRFQPKNSGFDGYQFSVIKKDSKPYLGKSYVYCETKMSGLSFIIDWDN